MLWSNRLNKTGQIKQILHCNFAKVTKWFYENYMMLSQGKCHFMTQSAFTCSKLTIEILKKGVKYVQS